MHSLLHMFLFFKFDWLLNESDPDGNKGQDFIHPMMVHFFEAY